MTATTADTCLSISSPADPPGFSAILAFVRHLAAEHNITAERAILAEARDRWHREQAVKPNEMQ